MHEKHRERMRKKLMENASLLEEHEILEVLLFYAIPRVNTNPIAHDLLSQFGSIEKILSTDPRMLMQVKGVGESAALFLSTLGHVYDRFLKNDGFPEKFSFEAIQMPIYKYFQKFDNEVFVAFFLDSQQRIIGKKIICDHSKQSVEIDLTEFSKHVVSLSPSFVVLCHNHLSGICLPTFEDDLATEKLCLILKLYNANLIDHIIVSGNELYSYFYHNRIEKIKEKVDQKI